MWLEPSPSGQFATLGGGSGPASSCAWKASSKAAEGQTLYDRGARGQAHRSCLSWPQGAPPSEGPNGIQALTLWSQFPRDRLSKKQMHPRCFPLPKIDLHTEPVTPAREMDREVETEETPSEANEPPRPESAIEMSSLAEVEAEQEESGLFSR